MNTTPYNFDTVTLLITHYNRTDSLKQLLESFDNLACHFNEIVVSDDCSNAFHQQQLALLQAQFSFRLITTPVNKGLGNNINKGQDAVTSPHTLYIQEDFVPAVEFPLVLSKSLAMMDHNKDLDIVRFYAYLRYPYLRPFRDGFSEMYVPGFAADYHKIYYYSDHPHLRRSSFFSRFGRYAEGIKGDKTEYSMCISFLQKKGKGLFYDAYQSLFSQENSEDEPSTMTRGSLTTSNNIFIKIVRDVYRQIKYNYDILFSKQLNNSIKR